MKKLKYIGQSQENECGLCCAAMILDYLGYRTSLSELESIYDVGRDGLSIKDIGNILKDFKYSCSYYKATEFPKNIKFPVPIILFWNFNHFVILKKIKNNIFYITDPGYGNLKLSSDNFYKSFSKILIIPEKNNQGMKNKHQKNEWSIYLHFFKKNKLPFFLVFLVAIVYYIFTMLVPIIMQRTTTNALDKNKQLLLQNLLTILITIAIFFGVYLLRSKLILKLSLKMDRFTYSKIINILLNVDYNYYLNRNSSDILYRITLSRANRDMLLETILNGLLDVGVLIIINIILFIKSIKLFESIFIITIIVFFFLEYLKNKIMLENKNEIIESSKLQGLEYELLSAIYTVKGSSKEKYFKNLILNQYTLTVDKYKKRFITGIYYGNINTILNLFGPLLFFILTFIITDITFSESIYVYSLAAIYFSSMSSVFSSLNTLGIVKNNMERINNILDQKVSVKKIDGKKITNIEKIEFKNVFYNYPGQSSYALQNINLTISKNEKVSLVGSTGSGKSTVLGLILGLYTPTKGNIYINNINIKEIDDDSFKSLIGFVPQQTFLFNKSIKENITMNRNYTYKEIKKACMDAMIWEDIQKMPMGLNTTISELGKNISGGQKQRIAIARALISNPKIVLLDEATSGLDNLTEFKIEENIKKRGVIQVNVAHRLSTVRNSNRIIVFKDCKIDNYGSHNYLLKNSLYYKMLYEGGNKDD